MCLTKNTLSEHWLYDCAIELQERMQPLFGPICNLLLHSWQHYVNMYLDENLAKGFILPSQFWAIVPILFVKKKIGLCECTLIVKDSRSLLRRIVFYVLPLISQIFWTTRPCNFFYQDWFKGNLYSPLD